MGYVFEGMVLFAIPAVTILSFDAAVYNIFVDHWNGILDFIDGLLVRAIERVERW